MVISNYMVYCGCRLVPLVRHKSRATDDWMVIRAYGRPSDLNLLAVKRNMETRKIKGSAQVWMQRPYDEHDTWIGVRDGKPYK